MKYGVCNKKKRGSNRRCRRRPGHAGLCRFVPKHDPLLVRARGVQNGLRNRGLPEAMVLMEHVIQQIKRHK